MASNLGIAASDFSMTHGEYTIKLILTGTVGVLMLGIAVRCASLLQSDAIARDSNGVASEIENLRKDLQQRFSNSTVTETVSNERTWAEIQDDLRSVYHDQPDLLSQTRFIAQQFDPAARVRLLPGLDGQPGTADFDDNANGVIDDAGELGATFSDDLCVVEASQTPANLIQPSIVLQRGAYVATQERITQSTHYRDRIVVLYEGRDNSWSFVLDQ